MSAGGSGSVCLAELLGVLALGADLGMGQPMDHALRQCAIAQRIGQRLGLPPDELSVVDYVSLLAWVGCHIDAYEQTKWFGDDLALKGGFRELDPSASEPSVRCSARSGLVVVACLGPM